MQYRTGTVSVTNGSNQVVGEGTAWLTNVYKGALFSLPGVAGVYTVASIADDTHLTLSAPWAGATAEDVEYWATIDFTPIHGLPLVQPFDLDATRVIEQALVMIDEALGPSPVSTYSVLSRTTTAPPSSPSIGASYIVPSGATGAWSGKTNKIAIYRPAGWYFVTPRAGASAWIDDDAEYATYNSEGATWIGGVTLLAADLTDLAADVAADAAQVATDRTAASTSATNAANSATAASTSATNAATSATAAASSATTATNQATTATSAASTATTQAAAAAASAAAAATAQAAAEAAAIGISVKEARAATTGNITLSGTQTIDGVAVTAGELVLVKDQSTASQNGLYVVAAGAWSRSILMDSWAEVVGSVVIVTEGTANGDTVFIGTSNSGGSLGSTAVIFTKFLGAGLYQANSSELTAIAALAGTTFGRAFITLADQQAARNYVGLGTGDTPQFTGINLGHATDTTITRVSAGLIAVEGSNVPTEGRANNFSQPQQIASIELGHATDTSITRSAAGVIAVEGSIVALEGRANNFTQPQQMASIELGHASDTTLTRSAAGILAVEGKDVAFASGAVTQNIDGAKTFTGAFGINSATQPFIRRSIQQGLVFQNAAGTSRYTIGRDLSGADAQNFFIYDHALAASVLSINNMGNTTLNAITTSLAGLNTFTVASTASTGARLNLTNTDNSRAYLNYDSKTWRCYASNAGNSGDVQVWLADFTGFYPGATSGTENLGDLTLRWATLYTVNANLTGSIVVGSPTGGDKGAGTINAQAVYDDNTLLTCCPVELWADGSFDAKFWDDLVPDIYHEPVFTKVVIPARFEQRTIPARMATRQVPTGLLDKEGLPVMRTETFVEAEERVIEVEVEPSREELRELAPARHEVRTHPGASYFQQMLDEGFDPRDPQNYVARMRADGAAPGLLTKAEWLLYHYHNRKPDTGYMSTRTFLAIDNLAVAFAGVVEENQTMKGQIASLRDDIAALRSEIAALQNNTGN
jgi:hypothetical protein